MADDNNSVRIDEGILKKGGRNEEPRVYRPITPPAPQKANPNPPPQPSPPSSQSSQSTPETNQNQNE